MEMSFVELAALLLLMCTYADAQEQQPDACTVESWPCSANSYNITSNYAFKLSSTDYLEAQEIGCEFGAEACIHELLKLISELNYSAQCIHELIITCYYTTCSWISLSISPSVKIYMTSCPTSSTHGPKWYKLEAISQVTSTAVGTFHEPQRRSEAHLCRNKTVSLIKTMCCLSTSLGVLSWGKHLSLTSILTMHVQFTAACRWILINCIEKGDKEASKYNSCSLVMHIKEACDMSPKFATQQWCNLRVFSVLFIGCCVLGMWDKPLGPAQKIQLDCTNNNCRNNLLQVTKNSCMFAPLAQ